MKFEIEFPDASLQKIVSDAMTSGFNYDSSGYRSGILAEKLVVLTRDQVIKSMELMDWSLWIKAAVDKYAPGIVEDVVKKVLTEQVRKAAKDLKDRGELV